MKRLNRKKLFKSSFWFLLLITSYLAGAQNTGKKSLGSTVDVENFIANNFDPDSSKVMNICQNSCVFIRFEISRRGKIVNVAFNQSIPDFITAALMNVFVKMEKSVTFSEALLSAHKVYLLPLIYNYQAGCTIFYNKDKLSIYKKDSAGNIVDDEQQGNALLNMLNFKDIELMFLDCLLLPPIRTGNMTESGFE